ncbi:M28 family peptidase [Pedobacter sp. UYP30]|uniref:M28 family metallopeptidase n=1 Tax=Pedobacter sp. UYP30 TaxID=1756400 RepID=UPI00339AF6A8
MKKIFALMFINLMAICAHAQDITYTKNVIDTLASAKYWGRGYTKGGMKLAADYLTNQFKEIGLEPLAEDFRQRFEYPVNTFPGKMSVTLNGKQLVPGQDFIVGNGSPGLKESTRLKKLDSVNFVSAGLNVVFKDKLTWSVATSLDSLTTIELNTNTVKQTPKRIEIDIENKFDSAFRAANICGFVRGTKHPDSVLMITAHYDHLGGMGADTYFPGANDNAAGVATLLSLAKYYIKNPQSYTVVFVCFAGEEAGLLGSGFFVQHPPFPLANIKFLINLDLVGTGSEGMTVVNSTVYPKAFDLMNKINDSEHLISVIHPRGKAANSDHYFFSQMGVPAFFIYTQGGPKAYHDIYDVPQNLPLTAYQNLFKLIVDFFGKLSE